VVVGLEFHCQLDTTAKLFSEAAPNQAVAPFDAAQPGTLPRLNWECVDAAVRLGFALGGDVQQHSYFERKHYLYPDLPHGFQITQQAAPIVRGGALWLVPDASDPGHTPSTASGDDETRRPGGGLRRLRVERVQMEMDTGKTVYAGSQVGGVPVVDLSRAGCALLEVVTAPELRSGAEAALAVRALQRLLRHTRVSTAAMEDGSLRCDVNVSVRSTRDGGPVGNRVEVKNLNSTRAVARAIDFEAQRHVALLSAGSAVARQTLGWDAAKEETFPLRDKEHAIDYRFIPEPDVPHVVLDDAYLAAQRAAVPELPDVASARLQHDHGVPAAAAAQLTQTPAMLAYFDAAARAGADAGVDGRVLANWLVGDFVRAARAAGVDPHAPPPSASPQRLAQLLSLLAAGTVTGPRAKAVLADMMAGNSAPVEHLATAGGGGDDDDEAALELLCTQVLAEHPKQAAQYRAGREKMMGLFVGQVMQRTKGKADPVAATALFERLLRV